MAWISLDRTIAAPLERVFQTVADIGQFSQALPHIVDVEYLTDTKSGVGTRFRETRLMQGREMETELEVTEYVENDRVRMVADSNGTVWDTLFRVSAGQGGTELKLEMEARAHKLLPRLMNPLIKGMVRKAVARDLELVQAHCEREI